MAPQPPSNDAPACVYCNALHLFLTYLEDSNLQIPSRLLPIQGTVDLGQRLFIPRYVALCLTRWYSMLGKTYPKAINSIKFWGPNYK